jgi:hypothetical protein
MANNKPHMDLHRLNLRMEPHHHTQASRSMVTTGPRKVQVVYQVPMARKALVPRS